MALASGTGRRERLSELVRAAALLQPGDRQAFLAGTCADDPRLRAEVVALLAHEPDLSRLDARDRQRVSDVFDAALGLRHEERAAFLDRACADRTDDRREVESLLKHAEDSGFLAQSALATGTETSLESAPAGGGGGDGGPPDPLVGRTVREFLILRKLGEGGMGVVYIALDTKLERHVAIKVVKREYANDPEYRKRLVSEAQLAARLSHPNIATVLALFEDGDDLFLVSEYVAGPTLREVTSRGPMPYARRIAVFTAIARGLEAAHSKGIIHRDLKPENILLAEGDVPKIVDFGLAKSTGAVLAWTQSQSEVQSRAGAGTPAYMAPEQIEDLPGRQLDFRCDLFSFGITLYEASTGVNPFAGRSLFTTLENIKHATAPSLSRMDTDLSGLDAIVQRCLRKNPAERYASTKELVDDLERLRPKSARRREWREWYRSPWTWWEVHQAALLVFYASALVLAWFVHPLARPTWASLTLAFLELAVGALLIGVRAHYLFASRQRLPTLEPTRDRYRRAVWLADAAFSAVLATLAGLMLYVERPGTAAPLVLLAVANVVAFLVVEPASEAVSFPTLDRPGEADDHERDDGPPVPARGPVEPEGKPPVTRSSGTQPAEGSTGFALAMYALLRERSGNVVFSPLSVRLALQVALAGARGDTAAQMRAALQPDSAEDLQEDSLSTMLERFRGRGGELGLAVANGVWTQEGQALRAEFREAVSRRFRTEVRPADFRLAAERTRLAINGWVSEQTRDRIRDLVPPGGVDADTRLVLASAVWFKDRWVFAFEPRLTRDERFYLDTRKAVQAPLMHQRATVACARGDRFQAVDLAYSETTCSLLILLPDQRDGLRDLEAQLTVGLLRDCVAGLHFEEVELFLPRFRIEPATVELGRLLSALGMRLAFSPESADFSGINGLVPPHPDALFVSAVLHQAFVEADESGTEAAAATAAPVCLGAPHHALPRPVPVFRADHPFLFAIRDRRSGTLLFLGRVADPTMPTARG